MSITITEIRTCHRIGRQSLDEASSHLPRGTRAKHARQAELSPQYLSIVRQFARRFSRADLDRLCALCREHQHAFGMGHLDAAVRLTLPGGWRLLERAAKQHWSVSEFKAQIAGRYGRTRQHAGRRRRSIESRAVAVQEIGSARRQWQGLMTALGLGHEDQSGETFAAREELPQALIRQLSAISDCFLRLEGMIDRIVDGDRGMGKLQRAQFGSLALKRGRRKSRTSTGS